MSVDGTGQLEALPTRVHKKRLWLESGQFLQQKFDLLVQILLALLKH